MVVPLVHALVEKEALDDDGGEVSISANGRAFSCSALGRRCRLSCPYFQTSELLCICSALFLYWVWEGLGFRVPLKVPKYLFGFQ